MDSAARDKALGLNGPHGLARLPSNDRIVAVGNALARFIGEAGLRPGDRLPTERALMASLAVGRSTVREVMRQFQARGIVETRVGNGTFLVRSVSAGAIHVPLTIDGGALRDRLLATLEVRRGLEVEAGAVAAARADAADLAAIEAKLDAMEAVQIEKGTAGREDLAFHLSIYDATHNPMFRQLLGAIREAFEGFFNEPFNRPDFARRSFPFHRELFDAVRRGDAAGARDRTYAILRIVEEDIQDMAP